MIEHPIEGLMLTAMNSIRDMIDVNTIIGEPIHTINDVMIIPVSKVGFGFASGGSEFVTEAAYEYSKKDKEENIQYQLPFGGGSGAGVSISPIGFLVVQGENVKFIHINNSSALDKFLDYIPDLIEKTNNILSEKIFKNERNDNIEIKDSDLNLKVHPKKNKINKTKIDEEITSIEKEEPNE